VSRDNESAKAPIEAALAPPRARASHYPEPFASLVAGRQKRPLGEHFGLANFGVNLTRLPPGVRSALHHRHSRQDEFVYVLEGTPMLCLGTEEIALGPGMCIGFPAGGAAHHLVNMSDRDVVFLEVGDRSAGDEATYPNDDLAASLDATGTWRFTRKDGTSY
jgi:uncharacterized cupin superfamily protein